MEFISFLHLLLQRHVYSNLRDIGPDLGIMNAIHMRRKKKEKKMRQCTVLDSNRLGYTLH